MRDYKPTAIAPASVIFHHYSSQIEREQGIDVFERDADLPAIEALLKRWRKDKTIADESILDAAWTQHLRRKGILPREEQREKDGFSLQKARDAKASLAASGMADAARFGYCKRKGCANTKTERLLLRGFCPACRGVVVLQTIPPSEDFADATTNCQTSLKVFVDSRKVHPATEQQTTEERRTLALRTREQCPSVSQRELARMLKLPQKTVNDILKSPSVKTKPENTEEVQQLLKERAEQQPTLKEMALEYLKNRTGERTRGRASRRRRKVEGAIATDLAYSSWRNRSLWRANGVETTHP